VQRRKWTRRVARTLVGVIVAAVAVSALRVGYGLHDITPRTGPTDLLASVWPSDPTPGSVAAKIEADQRVNLLLLAHGGAGNDNPNFTDTLLFVSIRPRPLAATVISLPRYLWVAIPAPRHGTVQGKLYSAFAIGSAQDAPFLAPRWRTPTGAGDLEAATVEGTIGQHVDAWIAVDQVAFGAVVDSLGGLSLNVPEPLDDWQYPVDDTERTMHVHFDAGPQLMNGERALEYARSRLSTSEADRSRRQELVLVAMMRKLRGFRPGLQFAAAIGPLESGLRTDLLPVDFRTLAALGSRLDPESVKRVTLEDSGLLRDDTIGTSNIVVPTSGGYAELRAYVAAQLP
jgi:polyisoprenyl-teichoic acid--peptidoglycan teichoic acid transferase